MTGGDAGRDTRADGDSAVCVLRLYLAGQTPRSLQAMANLQRLINNELAGRCSLEVIDLLAHPHLARDDDILAIPTLVRRYPAPTRRMIGDLSDTDRVLFGLELQTAVRT